MKEFRQYTVATGYNEPAVPSVLVRYMCKKFGSVKLGSVQQVFGTNRFVIASGDCIQYARSCGKLIQQIPPKIFSDNRKGDHLKLVNMLSSRVL
ncbi:uncharacterized protein OCT59_019856 [Rhizophagus irregularis]|uniref:uncharacterized protein n=1 Tax=Rhizophagus irregularis TaxID=588596 RepID=UPI00331C84DE|nr:hypothetical protein OCT59_019856 [Rhizophagus irregularis]